MTDWAALVAQTQQDNPHLEPNLHDLLPLIRDADAEVRRRGMPYPGTLRCIVTICAKADSELVPALSENETPVPQTADDLLAVYAGGNWRALGLAAAAWLQAS
ncbi:MAG: hypothetical protein U0R28_04620 [Candidatus Nanopelagicales bacterium]